MNISEPRRCCIPGCKSEGIKQGEKFCTFPPNEDRKHKWIETIRSSGLVPHDWLPTFRQLICQAHFEEDCFIRSVEGGPERMKATALPTRFPVAMQSPSKNNLQPTVSIIQTRRAAGIVPKPKVIFEGEPPTKKRIVTTTLKDTTAIGSTFRPVIADNTQKTVAMVKPSVKVPAGSYVVINPSVQTTPKKTIVSLSVPGTPKPVASSPMPVASAATPSKYCNNCEQLQERINSKSFLIHGLEQKIADLKAQVNRMATTRVNAEGKISKLKESLKDIYTEHQITRLCDGTTRGRLWDLETIRRAAKLVLACGRKGYQELLNQGHPFPSLKTLTRLLYKKRHLASTTDNPQPQIVGELSEAISESDTESATDEGSAEEIEENMAEVDVQRVVKRSRRSRKALKISLQQQEQLQQQAQLAQQQHFQQQVAQQQNSEALSISSVQAGMEEAALLSVPDGSVNEAVLADGGQAMLLQHPGQFVAGSDSMVPILEEQVFPEGALISQYGQLTVIQDSTNAAQSITGDVIEQILRAQNLTAAEVKEIRVEGSYITIVKHSDASHDENMMPQGIMG